MRFKLIVLVIPYVRDPGKSKSAVDESSEELLGTEAMTTYLPSTPRTPTSQAALCRPYGVAGFARNLAGTGLCSPGHKEERGVAR